jgi:hypothetical protein
LNILHQGTRVYSDISAESNGDPTLFGCSIEAGLSPAEIAASTRRLLPRIKKEFSLLIHDKSQQFGFVSLATTPHTTPLPYILLSHIHSS